MGDDYCHETMTAEGFQQIGWLGSDLHFSLWWHPQQRLEVVAADVNGPILVRGNKCYRLKAMTEEGQTHTRDLAALDDYLCAHFNEVHMWFSSYADITPSLARQRIREKRFRPAGGVDNAYAEELTQRLAQASAEFADGQKQVRQNEDLLRLAGNRSPLLQRHLQEQINASRRRLEQIGTQGRAVRDQLAAQTQLEKEYLQKGAATCLLFAISSNIQFARDQAEFADALASVVKELRDADRLQVRQKLQGGKLQIFVEEIDSPGVSLLTRWAAAALCPRQLARLGPEAEALRQAVERQFMVLPRRDILLGGSAQDERQLAGARIVRNFLDRLEKIPAVGASPAQSPKSTMPVWIGIAFEAGKPGAPWELPIERIIHTYVSGSTGSGKSFLSRAIVEGCACLEDLSIVVLDPGNQWIGLRCPEDRPEILAR